MPETEPQAGTEQPEPTPDPAPWESDDFDPERAWNLVQNLRGDVDKLKADKAQLSTKVDEFETANQTELERLTTRLQQTQAEAEEATRRALVAEVSAAKGLPMNLAKRLTGTTREELEADADELSALLTVEDGRPATPRRPREALRPGATPEGTTTAKSPLEATLRDKLGIN